MKKPCPAYEKQLNNTYKNPYLTRIDEENQDLYKYLSDNSGKQIKNILDLEFLYNTLEIEVKLFLTDFYSTKLSNF